MTQQDDNGSARHEYLVLSRGQWDATASPADIETAITDFYAWYEGHVAAGTMKRGHRLAVQGKVASAAGVTDGPFAEAKEIIGGYWFIVAASLDEAAALAARNPCAAWGLSYDVRPLELERASAYVPASETPAAWKQR
jgi:hypothetical protein